MTSPQDLPRQVRQNKNDIDDLFELQTKTHQEVRKIAGVQREHGRRLNSIDGTLVEIDGTLLKHGGRLDRIEQTLGSHGEKLDSHSAKLDSHSAKLDSHSAMHESHTAKLDEILGILRPAK